MARTYKYHNTIAVIIMMTIATRDTAVGLTMMLRGCRWRGGRRRGEGVDGGDDKGDITMKEKTSRAMMPMLIQCCLGHRMTRDGTYMRGGGGEEGSSPSTSQVT
jgi:hypothetical protein